LTEGESNRIAPCLALQSPGDEKIVGFGERLKLATDQVRT
jgi:hypothetical protein